MNLALLLLWSWGCACPA